MSANEGKVATAIESQTSKIPSDVFLWVGLGLLGTSIALHTMRNSHTAAIVGQIATPVLLMGLYNKTVKQQGHDESNRNTGGKSQSYRPAEYAKASGMSAGSKSTGNI